MSCVVFKVACDNCAFKKKKTETSDVQQARPGIHIIVSGDQSVANAFNPTRIAQWTLGYTRTLSFSRGHIF